MLSPVYGWKFRSGRGLSGLVKLKAKAPALSFGAQQDALDNGGQLIVLNPNVVTSVSDDD